MFSNFQDILVYFIVECVKMIFKLMHFKVRFMYVLLVLETAWTYIHKLYSLLLNDVLLNLKQQENETHSYCCKKSPYNSCTIFQVI